MSEEANSTDYDLIYGKPETLVAELDSAVERVLSLFLVAPSNRSSRAIWTSILMPAFLWPKIGQRAPLKVRPKHFSQNSLA